MLLFSKTNYLQELMVVKAFQTSIEVSKVIEYMDELMTLHTKYCIEASKFTKEQIEILNNFELVADKEDPLSEIKQRLLLDQRELDNKIDAWLELVFMGKSSRAALDEITKFNLTKQKRLMLKWRKMAPVRRGHAQTINKR